MKACSRTAPRRKSAQRPRRCPPSASKGSGPGLPRPGAAGRHLRRPARGHPGVPRQQLRVRLRRAPSSAAGAVPDSVRGEQPDARCRGRVHRRAWRGSSATSQIVMIPGGFSGGDEPDGSAKFITAFFRAPEVTEAVRDLAAGARRPDARHLQRFPGAGEAGAWCPSATSVRWTPTAPPSPSTTSAVTRARSCARAWPARCLPWMSRMEVGEIAHGGRSATARGASWRRRALLDSMIANGQVATQYVDAAGQPSMDLAVNPNGVGARHRGHHQPRRPRARQDGSHGARRRGPVQERLRQHLPAPLRRPVSTTSARSSYCHAR